MAKAITTLDVMSLGRAFLGIGTGWFEFEHHQLDSNSNIFDAGVDGAIINLPTSPQGYRPGHITALGEALEPRLGN